MSCLSKWTQIQDVGKEGARERFTKGFKFLATSRYVYQLGYNATIGMHNKERASVDAILEEMPRVWVAVGSSSQSVSRLSPCSITFTVRRERTGHRRSAEPVGSTGHGVGLAVGHIVAVR